MSDVSIKNDGEKSENWVVSLLESVWEGVVLGDSKWNPEKSCYDLYGEYKISGRSPDECVDNFIDWQTAKAAGSGFLLGLPGLAFGVVTIPADLTVTTYLQMRMIAVIALLYGWDPRSDRLKTLALLSMLGSGAGEAVRSAGVKVGTKLTAKAIEKLPGKILIEVNKAVGFRLLTKAGTKGVVNLTKFVPIVGGLVSGGLNAASTRGIGKAAKSILQDGPDKEKTSDTQVA